MLPRKPVLGPDLLSQPDRLGHVQSVRAVHLPAVARALFASDGLAGSEPGYNLALASHVPLTFEHMALDQLQVSPEQCRGPFMGHLTMLAKRASATPTATRSPMSTSRTNKVAGRQP